MKFQIVRMKFAGDSLSRFLGTPNLWVFDLAPIEDFGFYGLSIRVSLTGNDERLPTFRKAYAGEKPFEIDLSAFENSSRVAA